MISIRINYFDKSFLASEESGSALVTLKMTIFSSKISNKQNITRRVSEVFVVRFLNKLKVDIFLNLSNLTFSNLIKTCVRMLR